MLKIEKLRKSYSKFSLDCSLVVERGRITGLIGPNGAGKSTIFKAVLGLITPESGTITLFGKDIRSFTAADKRRIGAVLADSGFSGYLTAGDIAVILENLFPRFDRVFFQRQLEIFSLPQRQKIKDFSTGMKAKLKVVAALSQEADILILDEPTAGLDVVARDELYTLLRDYMEKDENRSILISSHISRDLETLCDDLYLIHEGKIILHEDTDVILSDYAILKADPNQFAALDKRYLLRTLPEPYGVRCLTDQGRYYAENYPEIAAEKGAIDELITMMVKGAAS